MSRTKKTTVSLYTVGHSTRPVEELVAMLKDAGIRKLWDVRRHPGSRRHPQFGQHALAESLARAGIGYRHAEALGGRRRGLADSPNGAWRNASFRAYADHLASGEFRNAFEDLLACAARQRTAVMCAEALPHRCHRRLIADSAVARGVPVVHLIAPGRSEDHQLHPSARVAEGGSWLVYPPDRGS